MLCNFTLEVVEELGRLWELRHSKHTFCRIVGIQTVRCERNTTGDVQSHIETIFLLGL